jgi:hypothetical protein
VPVFVDLLGEHVDPQSPQVIRYFRHIDTPTRP